MGYDCRWTVKVFTHEGGSRIEPATTLGMGILEDERERREGLKLAVTPSGNPNEYCSWREQEQDLREISGKYPHLVFLVEWVGENGGTHGCYWYHNRRTYAGEMKMVTADFDAALLKDET